MVGDLDLARWRLRTQHLVEPHLATAAEVVGALLAVQAENPAQSAWAVAARTAVPDPADLAGLLDDGTVVRTHVLRPTWHYVAADDVAWLIELTAPRVRRTTQQQLRAAHGMDDRAVERVSWAVLEALAIADLTRAGAGRHPGRHGLRDHQPSADDPPRRPRAPSPRVQRPARRRRHSHLRPVRRPSSSPPRLDHVEALAELALRYFTGHGPATADDLAYWATLPLGDVRAGLAQASDRLESFEHDGRTFWHVPQIGPQAAGTPAGHLLQILDEMYRGYQQSRWVLDGAGVVPREREAAAGMALVDAQLVAAMKRTVSADRVVFELRPYRRLLAADVAALERRPAGMARSSAAPR